MIYLITGPQSIIVSMAYKRICRQLFKDEEVEKNVYDGESLKEAINDANTFPMFSDNKIVVVKEASFLSANGKLDDKDGELLGEYIQNPAEFTSFFLLLSEAKLDERKAIVKLVKKACEVVEVKDITPLDMEQIITKRFKSKEVAISKDGLDELVKRVGTDLARAYNEVDKLALYSNKILIEDVIALVNAPLEDNIFALIEAIIVKDSQRAFKIYYDMIEGGLEVIVLIGMIGRQLRHIFQVKHLSEKGYSNDEIGSTIGIKPYAARKIYSTYRRISVDYIFTFLKRLADLDLQIKSQNKDRFRSFELFLLGI